MAILVGSRKVAMGALRTLCALFRIYDKLNKQQTFECIHKAHVPAIVRRENFRVLKYSSLSIVKLIKRRLKDFRS